MLRTILAFSLAFLLTPVSALAQSTRTDQREQLRNAQIIGGTFPGYHLRLKLLDGRKLEGDLVEKSPDAITLRVEGRRHTMSQQSVKVTEIREVKTGYGFGTRFKQRLQLVALAAIIIPTFAVSALFGGHPCWSLCD